MKLLFFPTIIPTVTLAVVNLGKQVCLLRKLSEVYRLKVHLSQVHLSQVYLSQVGVFPP